MEPKDKKILKNEFNWVPKDKRTDSFGLPLPPRKPELRKPLLWLDSKRLELGHELYLINSSGEVLDSVSASSGGFHTFGDDVITVASDLCEYQDVESGYAVKIDQFDGYYDLDYMIQVVIRVKSNQLGYIEINTPTEKGGLIKETVLLWDTGETGKYVSIKKVK